MTRYVLISRFVCRDKDVLKNMGFSHHFIILFGPIMLFIIQSFVVVVVVVDFDDMTHRLYVY